MRHSVLLEQVIASRQYMPVRTAARHTHPHRTVNTYTTPTGKLVMVYQFAAPAVLGVKDVRSVREEMQEAGCTHAILMSERGMNNYINKEVRAWGVRLECFLWRELNPTVSHYYVPHRLLGGEEAAAVTSKYGLDNMYRIQVTDPVVRFHGWDVGDILGIMADYGGFEGVEHFRVVV